MQVMISAIVSCIWSWFRYGRIRSTLSTLTLNQAWGIWSHWILGWYHEYCTQKPLGHMCVLLSYQALGLDLVWLSYNKEHRTRNFPWPSFEGIASLNSGGISCIRYLKHLPAYFCCVEPLGPGFGPGWIELHPRISHSSSRVKLPFGSALPWRYVVCNCTHSVSRP